MRDRTAYQREYRNRPEVRERRAAYQKAWKARQRPAGEGRKIRSDKGTGLDPLDRQRQWRAKNYARCLFHRCKAAAKRKGLPFDLTVEHIEKLLEPMVCPMTGVTLIITANGDRHPLQPSIDQIRAGEGYVIGNVRVVSWIYNRAKGMDGDEDVKAFALALVRQLAIGNIR